MIKIAERLRPFSHRPGTRVVIPGTRVVAEVFPERVRFSNGVETCVTVTGPLREFTVMQDLERGCVSVWGKEESRLVRYHILPDLTLTEKTPPKATNVPSTRLSLGSHKKQEWERIRSSCDFETLFPIWLRLAQMTPAKAVSVELPTTLDTLRDLFLVHFGGLLVPRANDEEFQGIPFQIEVDDPFDLLIAGAHVIESFFVGVGERLEILPHLPPRFHAGRFVDVLTPWGLLSIEWSKKAVRRVMLRAAVDGEVPFTFQKGLKSFRVEGVRHSVEAPLAIKSGKLYLLDKFQK